MRFGRTRRAAVKSVSGVLAIIVAACLTGGVAAADDGSRAWITGSWETQVEGDFVLSRQASKRATDVYMKMYPKITFHLLPGLSLEWDPRLDTTQDIEPGETKIFKDQILFTDSLYLSYAHSLGGIGSASLTARVFAGKYTLAFGRAWDIAPDPFGDSFAEDYEFEERVGVGAALVVEGGVFGKQVLRASTFFLDTSALSNAAFTPGRRSLTDGGVSNTGRLNSFALSWTAEQVPGIPGLQLQVAMAYQSPGKDGTVAEVGVVGSAFYTWKLGEVTVTPLIEIAHFTGADGVDGSRRFYLTASVEAAWKGWSAAVMALVRNTTSDTDPASHDFFFSVGGGYTFPFGFGAKVAYFYTRQSQVSLNGVGILFSLNCHFTVARKGSNIGCNRE